MKDSLGSSLLSFIGRLFVILHSDSTFFLQFRLSLFRRVLYQSSTVMDSIILHMLLFHDKNFFDFLCLEFLIRCDSYDALVGE